jgi:hypothetical protein
MEVKSTGLQDEDGNSSSGEEEDVNDGLDPVRVAEVEARDVLMSMLDSHKNQVVGTSQALKVIPHVEYNGSIIYKSILVSQLNGNLFLSKDRLTRVHNSIYFNNSEDYVNAASSSNTCLLGLWSDCAVYFVQRSSTLKSSTAKVAKTRAAKRKALRKGTPANIQEGVDKGSWWLGRVQKMRCKCGNKWGMSRQPVDLIQHAVSVN